MVAPEHRLIISRSCWKPHYLNWLAIRLSALMICLIAGVDWPRGQFPQPMAEQARPGFCRHSERATRATGQGFARKQRVAAADFEIVDYSTLQPPQEPVVSVVCPPSVPG